MGNDFVRVQKAGDGSVCKLWNNTVPNMCNLTKQKVREASGMDFSIRNGLQYRAKQDLISISKKISSDIPVIWMFFMQ